MSTPLKALQSVWAKGMGAEVQACCNMSVAGRMDNIHATVAKKKEFAERYP